MIYEKIQILNIDVDNLFVSHRKVAAFRHTDLPAAERAGRASCITPTASIGLTSQ